MLALSADTARFQSDLGRAQRVADKFGKEVGRTLGTLAGMLVALGGAAGFGALVRGQINAADEAGKFAQKTGIAVEELSSYMVAARFANVTNEELHQGFRFLAKSQAEFVSGAEEGGAAWRALGISQKDVLALNGDNAKLFELVASRLAAMADSGNKSAIAMAILGKSGDQLIPLINDLERTRGIAAELNAVIDKDTADAANRFNDNLTSVGISVQAMGMNVARVVLPTLEKFSERMVQAAKDTEAMDKAGRIADTGLKMLATAGTIVYSVFKITGEAIGSVAAAVVLASQGKFREAWASLKEGGRDMETEISGAITSIRTTWNDTARVIYSESPATAKKLAAPAMQSAAMVEKARKDMADAINRAHDDAMAGIEADKEIVKQQGLVNATFVESAQLSQEAADSMVFTWDEAGNRIEMTRESFEELEAQQKKNIDFGKTLGFTFTSAFEDAASAGGNLRDILKGMEQDIARIILRKAVSEPAANAIGSLIAEGMKYMSTQASARAGGGSVDAGMPYLVGEEGPEIMVPGASGSIVPNGALGGITIHQSIHVDARSDQASIVMAMRRAKDEAVSEIRTLQQRRGDSRV